MKYYLINIIIIIVLFYILNKIFEINEYFLDIKSNIPENNIPTNINNTIPKIIIQTWKNNEIPNKYKNDIESLRNLNPTYTFIFMTDSDINRFLSDNYPEWFDTYNKLPIKIQKIDFFRYIAVYHYGGFYFDLDITGLFPLDELLDYECVFPVDQNINRHRCTKPRYKKYCSIKFPILLGQYAFAACPKNKFMKQLIDGIHNNIDKYIQNVNKTEQYVYSSTGPDYVTDQYIEAQDKSSIHILNFNQDQFFGKYAKHNHYGTWK